MAGMAVILLSGPSWALAIILRALPSRLIGRVLRVGPSELAFSSFSSFSSFSTPGGDACEDLPQPSINQHRLLRFRR